MEKRYPFKYLDAYECIDKDFYFGRNEEVQALYEMTFQSDLLLVYGASGTGKTSLIQCGLANCFEPYNWLALTIRRGININQSLEKALNDALNNDMEYFDDEEEIDNSILSRQIKMLRFKFFKPIYLIFDQFEELYIINEDKDEQKQFYNTVKEILLLNQPVKIIIVIREEYLGYLYNFEQIVPDIMRKKLRIEPMTLDRVRQVLLGINNPEISQVTLQNGEEETLIQEIFNKLREGKISIELPYLQVLLDQLYHKSLTDEGQNDVVLSLNALKQIGNMGDILFSLLDGLVSQLKEKKGITPEITWKTLSCFVTDEGTKEPLSEDVLQNQMFKVKKDEIDDILIFFINNRILRYDENRKLYEIAHDALAKKIHDNRSKEEIAKLQVRRMIRDTVRKPQHLLDYFSANQLKEINIYVDQLDLAKNEKEWIEKSKKQEAIKKIKSLIFNIVAWIAIALLICIAWMYFAAEESERKHETMQEQYEKADRVYKKLYFYKDRFAVIYGLYGLKNEFALEEKNNVFVLKNDTSSSNEEYTLKRKDNVFGYNMFYFIDINGMYVEKLSHWTEADQFDEFTGFAKVIDDNNNVCLLDTFGNRYDYDENTIDWSQRELSKLPKEIENFIQLKYLDLSKNKLQDFPSEIGKLTNLTSLDLSGNQISILPPGINKLKNLTELKWEGNPLDSVSKIRIETLIRNNRRRMYNR